MPTRQYVCVTDAPLTPRVQSALRPAYHPPGSTGYLVPIPKTGVCANLPPLMRQTHVAVHWDDDIGGPELHPTRHCTYTLIHKLTVAKIATTLGALVNGK